MKYLKPFKIFESSDGDLLGMIKDIFISLDDLGIYYKIDDFKNIGLTHINQRIFFGNKIEGHSEEVNDCVKHLEGYLKDLGYLYFIGRSISDQIHISIENNFNKEIEKDFLKIIRGVKEVDSEETPHKEYYKNSRLWLNSGGYCLFEQNKEAGHFYYSYDKIYLPFEEKYSLEELEINEIVRYLVGKHLKIEILEPIFDTSR